MLMAVYTYVASAQQPTNTLLSETFTYTASDGNGGADTAEIVITVLVPAQNLAKSAMLKTDADSSGDVFKGRYSDLHVDGNQYRQRCTY